MNIIECLVAKKQFKMHQISPINTITEIDTLCSLLRESFKTVADDYQLTKENSPTNNAFITPELLQKNIDKGLILFGIRQDDRLVGCVGICKASSDDCYYIEKLCVLLAYRHLKLGQRLLDYAITEIAKRKCNQISIGIINENVQLKQWYVRKGFVEQKVVKYPHQAFTVCFLSMSITTFREITDDDIPLVERWLHKEYVRKWFSDPEEWLNEIRLRETTYSFIRHFIVLHNGQPIGFCQYYTIDNSEEDEYRSYMHMNAYSIDYVIGEEDFLGRGFGKLVVQGLCARIFDEEKGEVIVVKPEAENDKSCGTLLSVGFQYDKLTQVYVLRKDK